MDQLPKELHTWFTENEELLRSYGIAGGVERSPEDGRVRGDDDRLPETAAS